MRFKDIGLKFKALWLRQLLKRVDEDEKRLHNVKKQSWMMPVSHGYRVVEAESLGGGGGGESSGLVTDTVVVQREEIANLELWFYGVSNPPIAHHILKYLQLHLFNKKLKQSHLRRKSKEIMKTAYINVEPKLKDSLVSNVGSASAIVINGEKLVMAQMGDYRTVLCRDGEAYQLHEKHQRRGRTHWSRNLISGAMRIPKVRMQAWSSRSKINKKSAKSSEAIVTSEKIDSETEFVILASSGVWQVMRNQEAVDLIRHIDHPQEAAECLAKEALARMSRRNISCIIIRFD